MWSSHVLPMSTWDPSGTSSFLPHPYSYGTERISCPSCSFWAKVRTTHILCCRILHGKNRIEVIFNRALKRQQAQDANTYLNNDGPCFDKRSTGKYLILRTGMTTEQMFCTLQLDLADRKLCSGCCRLGVIPCWRRMVGRCQHTMQLLRETLQA